jgi:hypothetical protein
MFTVELPYSVILFILIIEREEIERNREKKSRRTMVNHTEFKRRDKARKKRNDLRHRKKK